MQTSVRRILSRLWRASVVAWYFDWSIGHRKSSSLNQLYIKLGCSPFSSKEREKCQQIWQLCSTPFTNLVSSLCANLKGFPPLNHSLLKCQVSNWTSKQLCLAQVSGVVFNNWQFFKIWLELNGLLNRTLMSEENESPVEAVEWVIRSELTL